MGIFTLIEHKIYHRSDLNLDGTFSLRNAVRAVIFKDKRIVLAYLSTTREYKFPGGGRKRGETVEDALRREVKEEIGATISSIGEKIAVIQEYDKYPDDSEDFFTMISEYYLVGIDEEIGMQNLDQYEEELGFSPVEIEIEEAIRVNTANIDSINSRAAKWIIRETYMLKRLKEIYA
jgi:8-oxo-dGTP pyrophosphatase MutT (NUDIX family)